MKSKLSLQEQADEVLKKAEEKGVQTNFFFVTTFKRYQVQMSILTQLEKEIQTHGVTVKKEYVKNRKNIYTNPAITEYNRTATAANGTVATLMNIVKILPEESEDKKETLIDKLNRLMADDEIDTAEDILSGETESEDQDPEIIDDAAEPGVDA